MTNDSEATTRRAPNFFVVGGQKCGTTSLHRYLSQHPDVFMAARKEPNYFNTDMYAPHFVRDESRYLSLFDAAQGESRRGEASPLYLHSTVAARAIKRFDDDAKVIILLRNPVDVMYSLHSQQLYNGRETIQDFETALAAEDDRKLGGRGLPSGYHLVESLLYRETVRFTEQVQRYLDEFEEDAVHIVIFDDLMEDPATVYRGTLEFLGVDPSFVPDFRTANTNKRVRSPTLKRALRVVPRMARRFGRRPPRSNVWRQAFRRLTSFNVVEEQRPDMSPELRARLQAELAPEVHDLGRLIGRDLDHWSRV